MSEPGYQEIDSSLLNDDHVRVYRETNGERGFIWNGAKILLLTTTGRKSGEPRTRPLIFEQDGDDFLVVASMGGAPQHPAWYLNLEAEPACEVQVRADVIPTMARTATPAEKPRLWDLVRAQWPNYDAYQTRTERDIPVVVLSPR
jgi:deazaflavin-dependent oxidoreductase (nitroreductase family)